MAWDVTVPDIYAESHIDQTAREACSAANKAAENKIVKYGALSASHIFLPVAVEICRCLEPVCYRADPRNW